MEKNETGYDNNGNPIDYVDKKGIKWIYKGKSKNGADNWYRCY